MKNSDLRRARFARLVRNALDELPAEFRDRIRNLEIVIEDEPPMERQPEGGTLLGLYEGVPLTERAYGEPYLPDRISIYQLPIEETCADEDEIRDCVAETVIHEFGHYFGMSEDEIEEIEEKFWRGESVEED